VYSECILKMYIPPLETNPDTPLGCIGTLVHLCCRLYTYVAKRFICLRFSHFLSPSGAPYTSRHCWLFQTGPGDRWPCCPYGVAWWLRCWCFQHVWRSINTVRIRHNNNNKLYIISSSVWMCVVIIIIDTNHHNNITAGT